MNSTKLKSSVALFSCRTIFTINCQQNIVTGFKAYVNNRHIARCSEYIFSFCLGIYLPIDSQTTVKMG